MNIKSRLLEMMNEYWDYPCCGLDDAELEWVKKHYPFSEKNTTAEIMLSAQYYGIDVETIVTGGNIPTNHLLSTEQTLKRLFMNYVNAYFSTQHQPELMEEIDWSEFEVERLEVFLNHLLLVEHNMQPFIQDDINSCFNNYSFDKLLQALLKLNPNFINVLTKEEVMKK